MIKSVFVKYILVFFVIITASFAILAFVISSYVIQNSIETKRNIVEAAAKIAKQNVEANFKNSGYGSFDEYAKSEKIKLMWDFVSYVELTDESLILVADLEGAILVASALPDGYLKKDSIPKSFVYEALNQFEIDRYQTLDGVFSKLHLVSPQILGESETGEAFGILLFCSGSMWDRFFVSRIINATILSCLWILVASMALVYFITEKTIAPVREMRKAAKSFEFGRFDARIPIKKRNDEIGELASAFNTMANSLASHEETQRMFLANVSHDLRTPMTSIMGFVEQILDGTIPPEAHEQYLKIVFSETKRLARLVSTLFEITKIQAGDRKFTSVSFDICETARQAIIFLAQDIEAKNLEFEFASDEDNIYVAADPDAIRQILDNLVGNAVKFTPEKGLVKISIEIKEKEKKAYISVYNTGTGIPAEDIPFVFDRFYKSDRSRGIDKSGAGLGLFIARTIIEAHREKIKVNSEYGKYCEFVFALPISGETGGKNKN
ncbi:MAG: HAMP domain-containing histidine kinase [Oscillospiraceae bacterium]|nr:HAMP domain-containing histidine kinase [Oscillospiraceae bacterium]